MKFLLSDNLSTIAHEVLRKRILICDDEGNLLETPEEVFWRVAWEVAKAERRFVRSRDIRETATSFFQTMQALDFLPNSPTLVNAGLYQGQLSACFVLPIEDSMESIFGALRDMALIQKTGGGSKREQVLRSGKLEETALLGVQACPECGGTMIETSGCISCSSCGYAFCAM